MCRHAYAMQVRSPHFSFWRIQSGEIHLLMCLGFYWVCLGETAPSHIFPTLRIRTEWQPAWCTHTQLWNMNVIQTCLEEQVTESDHWAIFHQLLSSKYTVWKDNTTMAKLRGLTDKIEQHVNFMISTKKLWVKVLASNKESICIWDQSSRCLSDLQNYLEWQEVLTFLPNCQKLGP